MAKIKLGPQTKDRTGEKIGRWTILEFSGYRPEKSGRKPTIWLGQCECGTLKAKRINHFKENPQCKGCASTKHGACLINRKGDSTYKAWCAMRRAYRASKNSKLPIGVYAPWLESFENFLEDLGDCPNGKILVRLNPTEGYSPQNCVWGSRRLSNGTSSKNHTGYRGVSFDEATGRYRATIAVEGCTQELGRYRDAHHAALAYDKAIMDYGLERDCLNFPKVVESLTGDLNGR